MGWATVEATGQAARLATDTSLARWVPPLYSLGRKGRQTAGVLGGRWWK